MGLQSKLFRGDPKLEAAAVSDAAHIMLSASGLHVYKIQTALILLDGAAISADEVQRTFYGTSTAGAVLAYKQKRNIINRNYQTQADNIVGKMTMASLDSEMLQQEVLPLAPVQIKPLSAHRLHPPRSPLLLAFLTPSQPLDLNVGAASSAAGMVTGPNILPGPNVVLEMRRHEIGSIVVTDGWPGSVEVADPTIVTIAPDAPVLPSNSCLVVDDPQRFKVFAGNTLGRTTITAKALIGGSTASIDVAVKKFFKPPDFHPGVNHGHTPCGDWPAIQANPNNAPGFQGGVLEIMCKVMSPLQLVNQAKSLVFTDKPIAMKHLDWYLTNGSGKDFIEDDNIKDWVTRDSGIRHRLKREIFHGGRKPKKEGHFTFEQDEFADDTAGQDFRFAFGAIDRVDFEVDPSDDTVRIWFQDRYEWHPVYPGLYELKDGDVVRETNCLHAALVELKDSGAADFWMKGEAIVPLSLIIKP